jgi:hypothetical protein
MARAEFANAETLIVRSKLLVAQCKDAVKLSRACLDASVAILRSLPSATAWDQRWVGAERAEPDGDAPAMPPREPKAT